jgi:nicotinamidase/pyrazinamidase
MIKQFDVVVASQDWHPPEHVSFEIFPPHCVQGTPDAEFIDGLETKEIDKVFRKGTDSGVDSMSVFVDASGRKATDIESYLRGQGVSELYVAGLATNYCVLKSALDAVDAGFKVNVVLDACRGIDEPPGAVETAIDQMLNSGINIVSSVQVMKGIGTIT